MKFSAGLTALAVAFLCLAELRAARVSVFILKPLASSGFLVTAVLAGAFASDGGKALFFALVFSFVGDLLLIGDARAFFLAGLSSFLVAHLAFAAAFVLRGVSLSRSVAALALFAPLGVLILRWLFPYVKARSLRRAVAAYALAITLMVVLAAGTDSLRLLVGATAFYLSDLAVARDRFVAPTVRNRLVGLPLYYGGQILLASSATR